MRGVIVVAACIVAFMVLVKDGRVLREAGLTGSCTTIAAPTGVQTGEAWERCKDGVLEGAPDLKGHGCTTAMTVGKLTYWRCPASIESKPGS